MEDKYRESDIHIKSKYVEKLENFWFYHKIHVLVGFAVVLVLTICIAQSCSKEKEDVKVLYAGPYLYSSTEMEELIREFNEIMPADFDGNGKKTTNIISYQVMNEQQITDYEKRLKENDPKATIDRTYFTTQFSTYNNYMLTGECGIFLLDPSLYLKLVESGRLKKLSEVFADVPSHALDEYGIKLSETDFYKNSEQLKKLPEDTVLCLSLPYVFGETGNKDKYADMTAMFVAIGREQ